MKTQRLDIRTSDQNKETLQEAANIMGSTLSSFMLNSSIEKAMEVLQQAHSIQLNESEHNKFISALDNPPQPNKALKDLAKKYNK